MMRLIFRSRMMFLMLLVVTSLHGDSPQDIPLQQVSNLPIQQRRNTTVLVYMAADNTLAPFANLNIGQEVSVGSNDKMNVLTYLCTKQPNQPKVTRKLFIQQGYCIQDGDDTPRDTGDVRTVIEALDWALTKFPSDRLAVIFWNHGSGSLNRTIDTCVPSFWWMPVNDRNHCVMNSGLLTRSPLFDYERAVCYDDTTGNYLTDAKLIQALSFACKKLGRKIDIIAFDACLMSDVEIAFTLEPYADYVVASQETIPGDGFGYDRILNYAQNGVTDVRAFAKAFVDSYEAEYQGTNDYTLAAIDAAKVMPAVDALNNVAITLKLLLQGNDASVIRYMIKQSRARNAPFAEEYYIDLVGFYTDLLGRLQKSKLHNSQAQQHLMQLLKTAIASIEQAVFAQARGSQFTHVGGLSVYFDPHGIDTTYPTLLWSQKTAWLPFLQSYLGVH